MIMIMYDPREELCIINIYTVFREAFQRDTVFMFRE